MTTKTIDEILLELESHFAIPSITAPKAHDQATKAIEALIAEQVVAVQNEWNAAIDNCREEQKQAVAEARIDTAERCYKVAFDAERGDALDCLRDEIAKLKEATDE